LCFKSSAYSSLQKLFLAENNKQIFRIESEYARMGVPNNQWEISTLNSNYELCDTYAKVLYFPASASSVILKGSASFRSRGRLPVLSYLHSNGASICRCAQPLAGFNTRCVEDEQLMQCILSTNPKSKFMYVVDTRPKVSSCNLAFPLFLSFFLSVRRLFYNFLFNFIN
jgi:hypothetical protein